MYVYALNSTHIQQTGPLLFRCNLNNSPKQRTMKKDAKEQIKGKLQEWKAQMENLYVQLNTEPGRYSEEFEEQKKNLSEWIEQRKEQLDEMGEIGEEKTRHLKQKLEELRVQAALGKAETRDAFKEQQKDLNKRLRELKDSLGDLSELTQSETREFRERMSDRLDYYHTQFDILRLKMHLARLDSEDAWQERKKDIKSRLNDLREKLEEGEEKAAHRWEHFRTEMGEAWKHLKKSISE